MEARTDASGESSLPPVRLAFLILAHRNPGQLLRLVSALPAASPVFIHFDRRAPQALYDETVAALKNRPRVHFVERYTCRWGAFGIIQGTIALIEALVAGDTNFDYAMLLSGSHYPVKSHEQMAAFFREHPGGEFIESFLMTAPNRWSIQGGHFKAPEKVLARHVRFRSRIWRLPGLRTLPGGLRPFGGSQWWCLSKAALTHIASFVKNNPRAVRFFRHSFIPDESFIQTVISNSPFAYRVTGDDLVLAIWDRPAPPYPATLMMSDLDMLRAAPQLFARKFDMEANSEVLDALDALNGSNP